MIVTENVTEVPLPSSLYNSILPLKYSASALLLLKPMPTPDLKLSYPIDMSLKPTRPLKAWKRFFYLKSEIPMPVSVTYVTREFVL